MLFDNTLTYPEQRETRYSHVYETQNQLTKKRLVDFIIRRTIANFLILFSAYMIFWVMFKPITEELKYYAHKVQGITYAVQFDNNPNPRNESENKDTSSFDEDSQDLDSRNPQDSQELDSRNLQDSQDSTITKGLLGSLFDNKRIEFLQPIDPQFSVIIPKLGANARVIENVNAAEEDEYLDALQHGIAHAAGTALPGEKGHIYLFAHSTNSFANVSRYNAIFYLLYKLETGDEINVFYNGARYKYFVTGSEIVNPEQVEYLTRQTDHETLTLQTCWPPGTTAKRLLIFAEPASVE